jgi:flagellar hook protein FlgE
MAGRGVGKTRVGAEWLGKTVHERAAGLPCYVVEAPGVAEQARAFVALNARRVGVTRINRFWAAHAAGDATATPPVAATPRATYGTSLNVYDTQGTAIPVHLYFEKDATGNTWNVFDSLDATATPIGSSARATPLTAAASLARTHTHRPSSHIQTCSTRRNAGAGAGEEADKPSPPPPPPPPPLR